MNQRINTKWIDFKYSLQNELVSNESILKAMEKLYLEVLSKLDINQYVLIIFKVKVLKGPFRNISYIQRINKLDYKNLCDIFIEFWSIRSLDYHTYVIESIVFSYKLISMEMNYHESKLNITRTINKNKSLLQENGLLDSINFGGYSLPCTMDITKWGYCDFYESYTEAIVYKSNSIGMFKIKLYENHLKADLIINDKVVLSFIDTVNDIENLGTFTREINTHKYEFVNNKLIRKSKVYQTKFIKPLLGEIFYKNNFITMDLETKEIRGIMEVYQISIFDGKEFKSFYLNDYTNSESLLKSAIQSIMVRKYSGYKVYLHNFSNFDGVFLLNIISSLTDDINIIIKEGKIIDLQMKFAKKKYSLYFRDSMLLLPSSLKKLAKSFNVEDKYIFPYDFVNRAEINLNYNGSVPEFKYFKNLSTQEYKDYSKQFLNKNWNLKLESEKYCNTDVKILFLVIQTFSQKIFNLFRINVTSYPTLSSLSFAIFRTVFLKESKIPIITGELFDFIKKSYTGGAVDIYKPYGKHIFRYDVNSLYPYIMRNFPMPVSYPTLILGDISNFNLNDLAFIETEVNAPLHIDKPILQTRIKTKTGEIKTISPVGTWIGVYSTNEIKKAKELGYKFKFIRALKFEKDYIFKDFVDYFYNLKTNSPKQSSDYTISKLILNSLSGRFALDPILDKHVIVDENKTLELEKNFTIKNITVLSNGKELVSYKNKNKDSENTKSPNVSISISATITSNARVYMSDFKNNNNLYYSDTDSIDTDVLLNPKFVGTELGKFKLEHIFKEVVYLAPKVYGGITNKEDYVKIKGLKNTVSFKELLPLLEKDKKLEIQQDKWYKDLSKGNIQIKNEIYTLMVTENKRQLVYHGNKFVATKPLIIKNETIVD